MTVKTKNRLFLAVMLALSAVFASVGGASAAVAVQFSNTQDEEGGNNGAVTLEPGGESADTSVYYLKGHAGAVSVKVKMDGTGFSPGRVAFSAQNPEWAVSPDGVAVDGGGGFRDEIITLTRAGTDGLFPQSKEAITIVAASVPAPSEKTACRLNVTPVEIDLALAAPLLATFYRGVHGTPATLHIYDRGMPARAVALAGAMLLASDNRDITAGGLVWEGDSCVAAYGSQQGAYVYLASNPPSEAHQQTALKLTAKGVKVVNDMIAGNASALAAGTEDLMAWELGVEVLDQFVSPDVKAITLSVSSDRIVTAWDGHDFAVEAVTNGLGANVTTKITGIAKSGDASAAAAGSLAVNGLTVAYDRTNNNITFRGTPVSAGKMEFLVHGEALGSSLPTSVDLTPAALTVLVTDPRGESGSGGGCDAGTGAAALAGFALFAGCGLLATGSRGR